VRIVAMDRQNRALDNIAKELKEIKKILKKIHEEGL